jgi:hypothetical protein
VSFPVVVHALEQLQQDGDEKAGQYLAAILRFEFIIERVAQSTQFPAAVKCISCIVIVG